MVYPRPRKTINPFKNNPYITKPQTFSLLKDYVPYRCTYCGKINMIPKWEFDQKQKKTKDWGGGVHHYYCDNVCAGYHKTVLGYKKFCEEMDVKDFERFLDKTKTVRHFVCSKFDWTEYDAAMDLSVFDTFKQYKFYKNQHINTDKVPSFFSHQLLLRLKQTLRKEFYIPEGTLLKDNLDISNTGVCTYKGEDFDKDTLAVDADYSTIRIDNIWSVEDKLTLRDYAKEVVLFMYNCDNDNMNALILSVIYGVSDNNIAKVYKTTDFNIRSRKSKARSDLRKQFPEVLEFLREVG